MEINAVGSRSLLSRVRFGKLPGRALGKVKLMDGGQPVLNKVLVESQPCPEMKERQDNSRNKAAGKRQDEIGPELHGGPFPPPGT